MTNTGPMDIIAWNVYIANRPERVRAAIKNLIDEFHPEAFILMEASRMYGHLQGLGYKVVQFKPIPLIPGNQPGAGNIAILIREDLPIQKRFALRMLTFWRGPKHGFPQDPRVYRWVRVVFQEKVWKLGGAHTPFGDKARAESRIKLIRWFKNTRRKRPTVLALDANMSEHAFREGIATPGGALAAGDGIDLVGYKNCTLILAKNLGRRISDHPAMLYRFVTR